MKVSSYIELGDIDLIESENPYESPSSSMRMRKEDLRKLAFNRNGLIFSFIIASIATTVPFVVTDIGLEGINAGIVIAVSQVLNVIFWVLAFFFTYKVNSLMSTSGKAILITFLAIVPILGHYIFIRSMFLSSSFIKKVVKHNKSFNGTALRAAR